MGIFGGLKKAPDLEEYLKGWIDRYYDNLPERSRDDLIERIVNNAGNKRYVENKEYVKGDHDVGQYHIANNNEKGSKVFELDDLKEFPDINSLEFNSCVMSTDSEVHKQMIAKINGLMDKFTGNNSKAAEDLKELLESSDEIEYRVRKGWEYNGIGNRRSQFRTHGEVSSIRRGRKDGCIAALAMAKRRSESAANLLF